MTSPFHGQTQRGEQRKVNQHRGGGRQGLSCCQNLQSQRQWVPPPPNCKPTHLTARPAPHVHLLSPDDQEEQANQPRPHRTTAPGPPPGISQERPPLPRLVHGLHRRQPGPSNGSSEDQATDQAQPRKNPSAREREEGNEDEAGTLPARRRRRAQTLDGKQSPSPRAAVASPHDAMRCAVASACVDRGDARLCSGRLRVRLYSGPRRRKKGPDRSVSIPGRI